MLGLRQRRSKSLLAIIRRLPLYRKQRPTELSSIFQIRSPRHRHGCTKLLRLQEQRLFLQCVTSKTFGLSNKRDKQTRSMSCLQVLLALLQKIQSIHNQFSNCACTYRLLCVHTHIHWNEALIPTLIPTSMNELHMRNHATP